MPFQSFLRRLILASVILQLLQFACKDNLTDKTDYDALTLSSLDVSTTSVVLRFAVVSHVKFDSLRLLMNGSVLWTRRTSVLDTLLFVEGLVPGHNYAFEAEVTDSGNFTMSSRRLELTTVDSTSHDIVWNADTVGGGNSSFFEDVAIVNDTLAIAVGEGHVVDSTGQVEAEPSCLGIWNGTSWRLQKLYVRYQDTTRQVISRLRGILWLSPQDIWLSGGSVFHWDGKSDEVTWSFSRLTLPDRDGSIDHLWGNPIAGVYGTGAKGSIVHYDGQSWSIMAGGTDIGLTDVWGTPDGNIVWACGNRDSDGASVLLSRDAGQEWKVLWNRSTPTLPIVYDGVLNSIWTSGEGEFFLTGSGMYRHSLIDLTRIQEGRGILQSFAYRIRGSSRNNLFAVGDYAQILHYNGSTWKLYNEFLNWNDRLYGLAVTERWVFGVGVRRSGAIGRTALVYRGRR